MFIMNHGENIKKGTDGGLTDKGIDQVTEIIRKIKNSQDPNNCRRNYITDVVTSDLKCCIETAEIAADILNVDIEKTPFHDNVPECCSEENFKIKVFVSMLLRGRQTGESKRDFYERVETLLSNPTVNKVGDLYYSVGRNGIPSPLLLPDDNYWRTHLIVTDQSMINAIYRFYCSYNSELKALAEKQVLVQDYASLYKVTQTCENYFDNDNRKVLYLRTGTIRKCNYRDF